MVRPLLFVRIVYPSRRIDGAEHVTSRYEVDCADVVFSRPRAVPIREPRPLKVVKP